MAGDLAGWLKGQMQARRIGRNELVRLSGVAAGTISRITLQNYVPGVEILHKLADFFGVDRETVLELAGVIQLSDLPADLPPELRDLARRLYRLVPDERQAILRSFDAILQLVENRPPRGRGPWRWPGLRRLR